MAPNAPYPLSTLRNILRAHAPSNKQVSSQADTVAFIAYLSFLQQLAHEAKGAATEDKGGRAGLKKVRLSAQAVQRASKRVLERGEP
ncbi:hypothetical protein Rhopal_000639-T1 [Rhodotorula paludigena]|uniref:Transcription factor CBF/NF-Y/archaeal histone domain-containing protein n=1 Tax=Rhodotorula paludigena TaxID=86838 RepID=A0AAV5GB81_9BASI|nr:hypothetical protein Rhopal_000639-T1 [Rhodotorula paludigena]